MEIRVETEFIPLVFELQQDAPEGVSVKVLPFEMRRHWGGHDVALAFINFAGGVSASLVAAWLFEKLKKGKEHTKISVGGKEIKHETLVELVRVLEEILEVEDGQSSGGKADDDSP